MHPDLLDILSHKESPISNQQLVDYLTGKMDDEQSNAFEKSVISNGMDNEALEGLQMLRNKEKITQYQLEINRSLRENLHQKKSAKKKKNIVQLPYLVILTVALLALIILVWVLFHFLQSPA
jgi:hypothetical protein